MNNVKNKKEIRTRRSINQGVRPCKPVVLNLFLISFSNRTRIRTLKKLNQGVLNNVVETLQCVDACVIW